MARQRRYATWVFDPRALWVGNTVENEEEFADALDGGVETIVWQPAGDVDTDFEAFSEAARRWIFDHPTRPLVLLVDEAWTLNLRAPAMQWLIRCSPAHVHVLLTFHRPADVPTYLRALVDHWYLFGARLDRDLETVAERCGPRVASLVAQLGRREFIHWDDGEGTDRAHRDGSRWYAPLDTDWSPKAPTAASRGPRINDLWVLDP